MPSTTNSVVVDAGEGGALVVELVLDVADEFLHDVVEEHDADGRAEFIDGHGEVGVLAQEELEQRVERHGVRHDLELALDAHQVRIPVVDELEEILDVDQADGVVEVAFDERETGVLAAQGDFEGFLERFVGIEHDHLVARRHHVAHPEFVEAEGVDEDLALGFGDFLGFAALGDEQGEFLGGVDVLALADRIDAENVLEQPVGGAVEEHDRPTGNACKTSAAGRRSAVVTASDLRMAIDLGTNSPTTTWRKVNEAIGEDQRGPVDAFFRHAGDRRARDRPAP